MKTRWYLARCWPALLIPPLVIVPALLTGNWLLAFVGACFAAYQVVATAHVASSYRLGYLRGQLEHIENVIAEEPVTLAADPQPWNWRHRGGVPT